MGEQVGLSRRVQSRTLTKSFGVSSSGLSLLLVSAMAALKHPGRIPACQVWVELLVRMPTKRFFLGKGNVFIIYELAKA